MAIISFKQRLRIYMRDHFTCVYCQKAMHPLSDDLTLDHIAPNHENSSDDNLATCCMNCNRAKGRKTPDFFLAKLIEQRMPKDEKAIQENNMQELIKAIANSHGIKYSQLIGKSRKRTIITARAEAIKKLREQGLKLEQIAKLLGYRDHSTILHHLEKTHSS